MSASHTSLELLMSAPELHQFRLGRSLDRPSPASDLKYFPHLQHCPHLARPAEDPALPAIVEGSAGGPRHERPLTRLHAQDASACKAADGFPHYGAADAEAVDQLPLARKLSADLELAVGDQFLDQRLGLIGEAGGGTGAVDRAARVFGGRPSACQGR